MYVKDMTMAEALVAKSGLEFQARMQAQQGRVSEQVEWDLEDVIGRIDELTDWY